MVDASETASVYEVPSMETLFTFPAEYDYVQELDWSPDGNWIAIATDVGTEIWRAQDFGLVSTLDTAHYFTGAPARLSYGSIDWAPDSERIVYSATQCHVQVWDVGAETLDKSLDCPSNLCGQVRWSPDGAKIAIGGQNRDVHVWDTETWRSEDLRVSTDAIGYIEWSPTGEYLAIADQDQVQIYARLPEFDWLWTLSPRPPYQVSGLAWSPDGCMLAMADYGGLVSIWLPEQDGQLATIYAAPQTQTLVWSLDNKWIATAGRDGVLRIFGVLP